MSGSIFVRGAREHNLAGAGPAGGGAWVGGPWR
jgi:hypothetical protein